MRRLLCYQSRSDLRLGPLKPHPQQGMPVFYFFNIEDGKRRLQDVTRQPQRDPRAEALKKENSVEDEHEE